MQIGPDQGALMALLIRLTRARRALEIGVFTGYSALTTASALPADGKLVACDVSEEWTRIARRYWEEAGVSGKIDLRLGPALETLAALQRDGAGESFDFAFIDADKENNDAYYEACLRLVRPNGLIAVDNTIWHGSVADPAMNDAETAAIRALNLKMRDNARVEAVLLTVGDGVMLARKREAAVSSPRSSAGRPGSWPRWRPSRPAAAAGPPRVAQAMCGVIRQFRAVKRGLSGRIGSRETTSTAAPASRPSFRASARSASTTRPPRDVLTRKALGLTRRSRSRLTSPAVSGVSGQCRADHVGRSEQLVQARPRERLIGRRRGPRPAHGQHVHAEGVGQLADAAADAAEADDAQRLAGQLRPAACSRNEKSGERDHVPSRTARACSPTRLAQLQQQGEGELGDGIGPVVRHVGHGNAASAGGDDVHAVVAGAGDGDEPQPRRVSITSAGTRALLAISTVALRARVRDLVGRTAVVDFHLAERFSAAQDSASAARVWLSRTTIFMRRHSA